MEEEEQKSFIWHLREAGAEYLQARLQLSRLQLFGKIAKVTAVILSFLIIGLLACFTVVFLGLMSGFLLADLFGSNALGFSIVGVVFIILLILLIVKRESALEKPMTNKIIQALFEDDNAEENPVEAQNEFNLSDQSSESDNS